MITFFDPSKAVSDNWSGFATALGRWKAQKERDAADVAAAADRSRHGNHADVK